MNALVLTMNALSCFFIVFRLIFVNRNWAPRHAGVAMATWLLAVAYFDVLVSMLSGEYRIANLSETVVNLIFCIALYTCRGDMNRFLEGGNHGHQ